MTTSTVAPSSDQNRQHTASAGEKAQLPLPACSLVLCTSHGTPPTRCNQQPTQGTSALRQRPPFPPRPAHCITPPRSPVSPFGFRLPSCLAWDLGRSDSAGGTDSAARLVCVHHGCSACSASPSQQLAVVLGPLPRTSALRLG